MKTPLLNHEFFIYGGKLHEISTAYDESIANRLPLVAESGDIRVYYGGEIDDDQLGDFLSEALCRVLNKAGTP